MQCAGAYLIVAGQSRKSPPTMPSGLRRAAHLAVRPNPGEQWKRQLLDGASELFIRGKQTKDKDEGQAKEAELFQKIGRLQMELEWLKKKSQLL
jgi:hypothetical protein